MILYEHLKTVDPEIYASILNETGRQRDTLELIASENFVSDAVLEAMGSPLTNKYAEGYPGRRYYGGCVHVDVAENLARDRAKELFGAEHANVQPHSGAQANQAVYLALLKPGDTVLGMDLNHGGHLTHGSPVNLSGLWFNFKHYGVTKDREVLDYEEVRSLAREHKPKLIVAGASAYPRVIDFARLRAIADEVEAYLMVDMAHIAGLIAAGLHPNPVGHAHVVTSTTHKTLRGPRGGLILTTKELAKTMDKAVFPGLQGGPLMHVIAAKAVAFREALADGFVDYQKQVIANAHALAEGLKEGGFRLVSDGTDNHLILVDVKHSGFTGKEAEHMLEEAGITVNKNTIPFDTESPFVTSGVRLGTAALTTRGMLETHMKTIARLMARILVKENTELADIQGEIARLAGSFPLYDHFPEK